MSVNLTNMKKTHHSGSEGSSQGTREQPPWHAQSFNWAPSSAWSSQWIASPLAWDISAKVVHPQRATYRWRHQLRVSSTPTSKESHKRFFSPPGLPVGPCRSDCSKPRSAAPCHRLWRTAAHLGVSRCWSMFGWRDPWVGLTLWSLQRDAIASTCLC